MIDPEPRRADDPQTTDQFRYGEYYYRHDCGLPYERNEHWSRFFGGVADAIVRELRPRTMLDVGCAMGFLVEELRIRGVEAWGIDVSEYAIENVHASVADYCAVSSAAGDVLPAGFPESFDLVACVEVIEHLEDEHMLPALANLTRYADRLLFSSSPEDYTEATHLNVRPPDHWSARLATFGMWRNFDLDASFLTPWAAVYDRREPVPPDLVAAYERAYALQKQEIRALRSEAILRHAHDIRASADSESELEAERLRAALAGARLAELEHQLARTTDLLRDDQLSILAVRDRAIGAEAEAGQLRALAASLESDLAGARLEIAQSESRVQGLNDQIEGMRAIVEHRDAMLASETWRIGAAITSPLRFLRGGRSNQQTS